MHMTSKLKGNLGEVKEWHKHNKTCFITYIIDNKISTMGNNNNIQLLGVGYQQTSLVSDKW